MSYDIANEINEYFGAACEVLIVSQIDRLVSDPWVVIVNTNIPIDSGKLEEIVKKNTDNLSQITSRILGGKYPINY